MPWLLDALFALARRAVHLRIDLRQDLRQLEVLRALPLSGRDVVAAEILGPFLVLSLLELAALPRDNAGANSRVARSPFAISHSASALARLYRKGSAA